LINASPAEIVFVRNATEAFNLVAHSLHAGDEVIFPASEHHSNYLPWRLHAKPVLVDLDDDAVPKYGQLRERLSPRTRLVTIAHASNVTGVIAPVEEWIELAHQRDVPVMVDASQSISHLPIDVQRLGCDFLAFSSHKIFGPSGVGVLYARRERLAALQPWNVGGGMVAYHGEERLELREPPFKFEAGTPDIEGAIGLGAAIEYVRAIGMDAIAAHSRKLGEVMFRELRSLPGARVLGSGERIALCTLAVPSANNVARYLADSHAILVSSGHHCAHVLHHRLKLNETLRASAHLFNDEADVEKLVRALKEL
jgi:cysteine desulfurase/selenocysteine lyase